MQVDDLEAGHEDLFFDMKDSKEWDFKLNREGQSLSLVYELNMMQLHGTACTPLSLNSIDKCMKGVEAQVKQVMGRVALSISNKDPCRSTLHDNHKPKDYVEDTFGEEELSLKFVMKFDPKNVLERLKKAQTNTTGLYSMHGNTLKTKVDHERFSGVIDPKIQKYSQE